MAKDIRSLDEIVLFGKSASNMEARIATLEKKVATSLDKNHREFLLRFGGVEVCSEWKFRDAETIRGDPLGIIAVYLEYPRPWEKIDLPVAEIGQLIEVAAGGSSETLAWHPRRKEFFLIDGAMDRLTKCGRSFLEAFNALMDSNEGIVPADFAPVYCCSRHAKTRPHRWGSMFLPGLSPPPPAGRLPSLEDILDIFKDIAFHHRYRNSEMVHLFCTKEQLHVHYRIESENSSSLGFEYFQTEKKFQKLMANLKPRLIKAGFGHSFRPWPPELFPDSKK